MHAADDRSVFETLETLPRILTDDASFARGAHDRDAVGDADLHRTVRLGLTAIGSRGNAFGAVDAPTPGRVRKAMAGNDPRQIGLIAAAYAIGVASTMASASPSLEAFAPSSLSEKVIGDLLRGEMKFDGLTLKVERDAALNLNVSTIEFLSPTTRLSGRGRITHVAGKGFEQWPLQFEFRLPFCPSVRGDGVFLATVLIEFVVRVRNAVHALG